MYLYVFYMYIINLTKEANKAICTNKNKQQIRSDKFVSLHITTISLVETTDYLLHYNVTQELNVPLMA